METGWGLNGGRGPGRGTTASVTPKHNRRLRKNASIALRAERVEAKWISIPSRMVTEFPHTPIPLGAMGSQILRVLFLSSRKRTEVAQSKSNRWIHCSVLV